MKTFSSVYNGVDTPLLEPEDVAETIHYMPTIKLSWVDWWHDVANELPEPKVWVLVAYKSGHMTVAYVTKTGVWHGQETSKMYTNDYCVINVPDYWIALPELREGDDETD